MISIDIKNPSIMEKILIYIFVNKDTLLKDTQLTCTLNRVKNDNLEIMLGYGKYKLAFDNKLIKIDTRIQFKTGLRRSTEGQPVVKGIAALALLPTETYTEIEYYERKTNN